MAISVRGEQKRGKRKSSQVTKVVFKETSFVLNSTSSLSEFLQHSKAQSIVEFQVSEVIFRETSIVLNTTKWVLAASKADSILEFQVDGVLLINNFTITEF